MYINPYQNAEISASKGLRPISIPMQGQVEELADIMISMLY